VIATRDGLADKIFQSLFDGRSKFLKSIGLPKIATTYHALSDLESKHGMDVCPDTSGFMSGISSIAQSNLQKYLRVSEKDNYMPDSHRFVNHTKEAEKVFSYLLKEAPRNKRIMGEARKKYGIKKRNVTILDPDQPSLTITTIPDDFIHYSEPRVMTVRECARLQTFPDWFEFKGPYTTGGPRRKKQTPRYTQVGNAVPPLFAEQVGLAIQKTLQK
jgi:DNA (cytosine-5)-methyltransferase 1